MATLVVGPFYLTFALHLNEALVGLVMAVGPVMAALSGVPAGRITDRFGAGRTLIVGLGQMVIGLLCLSVLPDVFGVAGYILSLMLLTPGFQLFLAANNTTVMLTARDDQRGMISGLLGLSRNLGFMTGTSAMGAVFAMAAGTPDIVGAAPEAISAAFATTFQMAAGLMAFAILLAVLERGPSR
ncbi:MFS transporter [Telmatospirillum sp. J64-1]|uniref:MFS transporter n=1 Tax=Telmatospirillum sp. J64-1 TaxID=2502183 RepID=UPI001C8F35C1|nr:MFS transporter [Telmatospirillum sp. J64-1]